MKPALLFCSFLFVFISSMEAQTRGGCFSDGSAVVNIITKKGNNLSKTQKAISFTWFNNYNGQYSLYVTKWMDTILIEEGDSFTVETDIQFDQFDQRDKVHIDNGTQTYKYDNTVKKGFDCRTHYRDAKYKITAPFLEVIVDAPDSIITIPIVRMEATSNLITAPGINTSLLIINNNGVINNVTVNSGIRSVFIYDVIGREVFTGSFNENSTNLLNTDLSQGNVYILKTISEEGVQSQKLYLK